MKNKPIAYAIILTAIIALVMQSGCITDTPETQPQVTDTDPSDTGAEDTDIDAGDGTDIDADVDLDTQADDGEFIRGNAIIEKIDILTLESFPLQIHVTATGYFPDGCTSIDEVTQSRQDNTFTVAVITKRPADVVCTMAIVPFEETISLDVYGLDKGVYTVNVNDASGSFELPTDNIIPE
ncbi:MAG: hypothetical protein KAH86_03670 [Methanosarcinales archaeon]|nr:hypothetical protein [Methanosarcinales archaeon]